MLSQQLYPFGDLEVLRIYSQHKEKNNKYSLLGEKGKWYTVYFAEKQRERRIFLVKFLGVSLQFFAVFLSENDHRDLGIG